MSVAIDIKYAARLLFKKPAFTALTVLIVAVGLGLTLYTYSLLNNLVFKPLVVDGERPVIALEAQFDYSHLSRRAADPYHLLRAYNELDMLDEFGFYEDYTALVGGSHSSADKKAKIIVGFSEESDKKTFLQTINSGNELELLNVDFVKKGDTFLVPAGRVHAIGKGVLLAEIQETSDVTYRISDWSRRDNQGKERDLHVDLALDAIDYSAKSNYKAEYLKKKNNPSNIVDCKYFTTNFLHLTKDYMPNHEDKDSFVIYMCVEGTAIFEYKNQQEKLQMGETILIPACIKKINVITENAKLLEVYIK